ncbi:LysR family transcriptional regulator [Pseudomonas aeruginosa]|nr:LysR family transcriptional regulator [Pseudomonas aeruginosa]MCO1779102.1 LysR family transcriptional regulator [Pseudomonas aeruginosa]MCO1791664.1 LysR family transcriptional regulator [Pseudomonas aeruginosa]MCO1799147.1 LysR family transcriptional regulator [Pseudomonas aeruginosa]MDV6507006.1 LysR family transcriptional regulator [Pseudomonas aeruginosa]
MTHSPVKQMLKEAGLKMSLARLKVIDALWEASGEQGRVPIRTLHRRLSETGTPLSLVSIRQVLGRLVESGLASFAEACPEIELEILLSSPSDGQDLPLADVEVRGDSHGVAAGERLLEERVLPMAAPGLLLGLPRPWTPAMLAGLPLLRSPLEPWQPWFRVAGLDWPEPCAGPRLLDLGMTLEAAANGQGVALARPSLARAWLAEGRLVVLFPLRSAPTHHYHLRSHQASPASQRFAAWLAAICREAVVQGREFLPAADD